MLKIVSPNGTVCLYSKSAQDYFASGGDVATYCKGQDKEPNQAIPVCISWETDKKALSFFVKLYTSDLEDSQTFTIDGNFCELNVFNLLKATTYNIEVTANYLDGSIEKAFHCFSTTERGPRPLQIGGVFNTRDIGGYLLPSGKRTKQNKIFRGGALTPCKDFETVDLTEKGKTYMSEVLGVKTEIDFRNPKEAEKENESAIPNAKLVYAILHGYDAIIDHKEGYKFLFSILADESNYPIYMHCTGGADRTGTVCFIINALLGVDLQTLIEDYEFTTFSYYTIRSTKSDWTKPLWEKFMALLNSYRGNTVLEKTENLLLSIGITKKQINSLRRIMID